MRSRPAPMLCATTRDVPAGDGWVLTPKHDGWRLLWALDQRGRPRAWTRSGSCRDGCYPALDEDLREHVGNGTILDGELVALKQADDGRVLHDFGAIAGAIRRGGHGLHYVVFDVLTLDGEDLTGLPWSERRAALEAALARRLRTARVAQALEPTRAQHERLLALGFEGSVFKRRNSRYVPGRRSRSWLKLKARLEREVVLAGFGPRSGTRSAPSA